jgi:hypothetical protein
MGRSSEWLVSKDPSERVSGLARYQVSHTVYQNGPSRRRSLLGQQAGLSDPKAGLANQLQVNPSGPEARLFAWNHPTGVLRPLSRAMFTKYVSSAATAAGLSSFKRIQPSHWRNPRIPATRHPHRCRQIYGELVQRIIYHLPASTRHDPHPIYAGYAGPRAFYTL